MNVQHVVDQIVIYLRSPLGWVPLVALVLVAFFMMRGEHTR